MAYRLDFGMVGSGSTLVYGLKKGDVFDASPAPPRLRSGGRPTGSWNIGRPIRRCVNWVGPISLVEPPIPLSETNELVFDSVGAVLIEDFVNGSSESFGVSIRQALVVIE